MFKIEIEDDYGVWTDVRSPGGTVMTFETEDAGHAKLAELYPVMVKMESYTGGKHTRVVRVFRSDAEWKDGAPTD